MRLFVHPGRFGGRDVEPLVGLVMIECGKRFPWAKEISRGLTDRVEAETCKETGIDSKAEPL